MKPDMFIVILAGVVFATMQLSTGTLLLLYHASFGKHVRKKTRELVTNYILGNALLITLMAGWGAFIVFTVCNGEMSPGALTIVAGIMVAVAIAVWTLYYRRGKSTELWLPKSVARFIDERAKKTESMVESFSLGMLSCFVEMPFTAILILVVANSIVALPQALQILALVIFVVLAVMPMILVRVAVRRGQTVVDIQRWRLKNKNFIRIVSGLGFLVLALFIIAFKVLGN